MYGEGLLKGLGVTFKHYFQKTRTQEYPDVMPDLPPTVKNYFRIDPDKCTSCGICANTCPNRVISIEKCRDENNKWKLTDYSMNLMYCLFCGFCVESCPQGALTATQDFEKSVYTREETKAHLFHEDYVCSKPEEAAGENGKEEKA